ncbi:lipoate--protein ligase family protein [Halocalculus aciditolerans]|uniref:lipoate--protein ligase family protein n=1 Tax=Halocalculus aciditolerans TaxID=1383812 RepID=UPI001E2E0E8F|nr:lipoate--protein ligase family protein [Halocalculus aciditolerans]
MYVVRGEREGEGADEAGRAGVAELLALASSGEPAIRVWRPGRCVAFGRRDTRAAGYEEARAHARVEGFEPVERSVGGRAVAYTASTVAFARADPVEELRAGMNERYARATSAVQRALWHLGVPAEHGEPPESFCPGDHSLQYEGKLVGVAQRVTSEAALASGVLLVDDREEISHVLDGVYRALDAPFDPESVGTVADAGGETAWERVREELEYCLATAGAE